MTLTPDDLPLLTPAEVEALTGFTPERLFALLDSLPDTAEVVCLSEMVDDSDPDLCSECGQPGGEGAYCDSCGVNFGP